jgi:hypothetical protein
MRVSHVLDSAPFTVNDLEVVSLTFASWNQIGEWLRKIGALHRTA